MYRILAAALLALALAPAAAAAKGIEQVNACGADGCRTTKSVDASAHGLIPPVSVPEPAPFYRLAVGMGHAGEVFDTVDVLWAPSLGMIAYDEPDAAWVWADEKTRRVADRITEGLEPFPASEMPVPQTDARVDEVVTPAAAGATAGGGGPPWAFLAGGVVAAVALLLTLARRRGASRGARSASPPPSPTRG